MEEDNRPLIKLYIQSAREALDVAAYTISGGYYGVAVNRCYSAFFYSASALLLTKDLTRNKHVGVLAAFRRFFIKEGLVDPRYGEIYGRVFELRNDVDYDLVVKVSEQEARYLFEQAQGFVEYIIAYLVKDGFYVA